MRTAPVSPIDSARTSTSRPGSTPAISWPRLERAQPLIPSWFLALIAVAAIALLVAHAPGQGHPVPIAQHPFQPAPTGPCGPGWQVQRSGAGGFTLRTIGAFVRGVPTPCIVPIAAGTTTLDVHAAGDAALLSTIGATMIAPIPASGWYAVPVNPAGDELLVEPDLRGGDLTLTVVMPHADGR